MTDGKDRASECQALSGAHCLIRSTYSQLMPELQEVLMTTTLQPSAKRLTVLTFRPCLLDISATVERRTGTLAAHVTAPIDVGLTAVQPQSAAEDQFCVTPVTVIDEWPRRSWMALGWAPSSMRIAAHEWRRS
jgi:hypothetical protein